MIPNPLDLITGAAAAAAGSGLLAGVPLALGVPGAATPGPCGARVARTTIATVASNSTLNVQEDQRSMAASGYHGAPPV